MLQKFQSSAGYGLPSGHIQLPAHPLCEVALFLLLFNGWSKTEEETISYSKYLFSSILVLSVEK